MIVTGFFDRFVDLTIVLFLLCPTEMPPVISTGILSKIYFYFFKSEF